MKVTSRVLLYGLFLGLVSSQSLMDLFLGLCTLFGIYLWIRSRSEAQSPCFPKWFLIAIPWFLWVVIGFLAKATDRSFMSKALGDFLWIFQLPLLVYIWKEAQPDRKLIHWLLTILAVSAGYAVIIYFLGFDPLFQSWSDRATNLAGFWRSGGLFSNAMALAQSYGPLTALLFPASLFFVYRKNHHQLLVPFTLTLTAFAVLFTFTRGVWLSLVIAAIIGSFVFSRRLGLITVVILLIGGSTLLAVWPKFRERTLLVFDTQKSYDSERIVLWKTNWYIFTQNPVLGIGYGENKRRLREFYDVLDVPAKQFEGHAHNQYLHFLAGTGSVGLAFYLIWCGLFIKLTHQLYSYYQRQNMMEMKLICLGLLMAQLAFHIGSITEANFTISKNRMMLVMLWSGLVFLHLQISNRLYGNCKS